MDKPGTRTRRKDVNMKMMNYCALVAYMSCLLNCFTVFAAYRHQKYYLSRMYYASNPIRVVNSIKSTTTRPEGNIVVAALSDLSQLNAFNCILMIDRSHGSH